MASGAPARGVAGRSRLASSVSPVPSGKGNFSRSLVCGASVSAARRRLAMVCRSLVHQGKRGWNGGRSGAGSRLKVYQTRSRNFSSTVSHHGRSLSAEWKPRCPPPSAITDSSDGLSDHLKSR